MAVVGIQEALERAERLDVIVQEMQVFLLRLVVRLDPRRPVSEIHPGSGSHPVVFDVDLHVSSLTVLRRALPMTETGYPARSSRLRNMGVSLSVGGSTNARCAPRGHDGAGAADDTGHLAAFGRPVVQIDRALSHSD